MRLLLTDGRVLWIPAGKRVAEANKGKETEVLGPRNRVLLTFTNANIVAWWWDNVEVEVEAKAQ